MLNHYFYWYKLFIISKQRRAIHKLLEDDPTKLAKGFHTAAKHLLTFDVMMMLAVCCNILLYNPLNFAPTEIVKL